MNLNNIIEYQRRELCKDLPCQILLNEEQEGTDKFERIRAICGMA
jgi:hypothetical protein